jgi:hypothetical protein
MFTYAASPQCCVMFGLSLVELLLVDVAITGSQVDSFNTLV